MGGRGTGHMSPRGEAVKRAAVALLECHPDDAEALMSVALLARRNDPSPPFLDVQADAELWAAGCSPLELVIYAKAALSALLVTTVPREDRLRLAEAALLPLNVPQCRDAFERSRDALDRKCREAAAARIAQGRGR